MSDIHEEITEFWISANNAFRFFTRNDKDGFLLSLNDSSGMPPKGTNVLFQHIKLKNPISKVQLMDMSDDDMKLFLEMNKNNQ